MRVVYIHAATADLTDGDAAAIAGARIVQDTSVDRAGLGTLLALLADGDDLLVPKIGHLGATARTALASLRRAADAGVRVSILQDGLDGAAILRVAELLESLPNAGDAGSHPRPGSRAYGRAAGSHRRDPLPVRGRRHRPDDRDDGRAVGRHGHARPPRPSRRARAPTRRWPRRVPGQCRLIPVPEARP